MSNIIQTRDRLLEINDARDEANQALSAKRSRLRKAALPGALAATLLLVISAWAGNLPWWWFGWIAGSRGAVAGPERRRGKSDRESAREVDAARRLRSEIEHMDGERRVLKGHLESVRGQYAGALTTEVAGDGGELSMVGVGGALSVEVEQEGEVE